MEGRGKGAFLRPVTVVNWFVGQVLYLIKLVLCRAIAPSFLNWGSAITVHLGRC